MIDGPINGTIFLWMIENTPLQSASKMNAFDVEYHHRLSIIESQFRSNSMRLWKEFSYCLLLSHWLLWKRLGEFFILIRLILFIFSLNIAIIFHLEHSWWKKTFAKIIATPLWLCILCCGEQSIPHQLP